MSSKGLEAASAKQEHYCPSLRYHSWYFLSPPTCFRKYSADADPLAPELKLSTNLSFHIFFSCILRKDLILSSTNLTVFSSKGTVVPPDVTNAIDLDVICCHFSDIVHVDCGDVTWIPGFVECKTVPAAVCIFPNSLELGCFRKIAPIRFPPSLKQVFPQKIKLSF